MFKRPSQFPPPAGMVGLKLQVVPRQALVMRADGRGEPADVRDRFEVVDADAPYVIWAPLRGRDRGAWQDLRPDYLADDGAGSDLFHEGDGHIRHKLDIIGVSRLHWDAATPGKRVLALEALRAIRAVEFAVGSLLKHARAPVVIAAEKQLEKFVQFHRLEEAAVRGLRAEKTKANNLPRARDYYSRLRPLLLTVKRAGTGRTRNSLSSLKWLLAKAAEVNHSLYGPLLPLRRLDGKPIAAEDQDALAIQAIRRWKYKVLANDLAKLRTKSAATVAREITSRAFGVTADQLRYKAPRSRSKRVAK